MTQSLHTMHVTLRYSFGRESEIRKMNHLTGILLQIYKKAICQTEYITFTFQSIFCVIHMSKYVTNSIPLR